MSHAYHNKTTAISNSHSQVSQWRKSRHVWSWTYLQWQIIAPKPDQIDQWLRPWYPKMLGPLYPWLFLLYSNERIFTPSLTFALNTFLHWPILPSLLLLYLPRLHSPQHCAAPRMQCHWDERNYPQRQNQTPLAHLLHTNPVDKRIKHTTLAHYDSILKKQVQTYHFLHQKWLEIAKKKRLKLALAQSSHVLKEGFKQILNPAIWLLPTDSPGQRCLVSCLSVSHFPWVTVPSFRACAWTWRSCCSMSFISSLWSFLRPTECIHTQTNTICNVQSSGQDNLWTV